MANLAASIYARLSAHSKARGEDFHDVIIRYGIERFLYRISVLPMREAFLLKGALLFHLWFDSPHRRTRDADFLGFGPMDAKALEGMLREACAVAAEDGMIFDADSIRIAEIREDARYGGLRVNLLGRLSSARCPVQIDVGYGDAVTPGPDEADYPTLLAELPAPRLRVYPRETVIAEKFEAIVSLGMTNSRMKDYFDLRALALEAAINTELLAQAIAATCERRQTPLPSAMPIGLSDEFGCDRIKITQWEGFLRKNRLEAPSLDVVVSEVRAFLEGPLRQASKRREPT